MCGITGFLNLHKDQSQAELSKIIREMSDTLTHRGPDDSGFWVDQEAGIALGFRRLAIIDLSPTGKQPMLSHSGRFVMIYNGEIYNFQELKVELQDLGVVFQGTSDTEVMLEAIDQWGLVEAVKKFNGMFAFALWDRQERSLALVRDRIGIKPLYYGWQNGYFLFGSELKAMVAHPNFSPTIDRNALALFMRHNYIPTPYSIYENIFKLKPGHILFQGSNDQNSTKLIQYWSAKEIVEQGVEHSYKGTFQQAGNELESLLKSSIQQRMISDVPLGAFLSGGVDSSTIVSMMQAVSTLPVKTFTIGFHEQDYDEARFARKIAEHLHTEHTELYVTPRETLEVIPRLPMLYDEPFADASQIPTFLIAQLARQSVTVSLSGDGGDELFGGYNRYSWAKKIHLVARVLPKAVKNLLFGPQSLKSYPSISRFLHREGGKLFRLPLLMDKIEKISEIIYAKNLWETYYLIVSHWKNPQQVVFGSREPVTKLTDSTNWPHLDDTRWMMYLDLVTYLPDDILVKTDRASMGVSLEARVPFIDDRRIAEFAWRLPTAMKIKGGHSKRILRDILYRHVPRELIDRPKMGFALPIDQWLRTSLRDWSEELLDPSRMKNEGFFESNEIRKKWQEHLNTTHNWQYLIWNVLMFQAWLNTNKAHRL